MSTWYFEKRDPRGVRENPKHDEHFAHIQGIVDSLIRETTQNSGDAVQNVQSSVVRMTFRFGKVSSDTFERYVGDLAPHLECFAELSDILRKSKMVRYLAIEDFETHGLRGSFDPESSVEESSYIAFWHRYGESGKSAGQGGRHGLGKSTISSSSEIRLFFGATVPSDSDPKTVLLQGQASLKHHKLQNADGRTEIYDPYGLWYNETENGLLPFIDKAAHTFLNDFELKRERNPGLSLIIPFPDENITPDSILKAVIENCFHQIINGQFVINVEDVRIDSKSIFDLAASCGLEKIHSAMALSSAFSISTAKPYEPRIGTYTERLSATHFTDEALEEMRQKWRDGDIISVRLPVNIRRKKKNWETGSISLLVRRESDPEQARETYVRGRVSVRMNRIAKQTNFVGLFVADEGIASTFLGDAEPPAHNRWSRHMVKPLYSNADDSFNRIVNGLRDLLNILDKGYESKPIKDAFVEYFWTPRATEEPPEPSTKAKKPVQVDTVSPPPPPPPPAPKLHEIEQIPGGFLYSYVAEAGGPISDATIAVSYCRRGAERPSKKAKFSDFHIEDFKISHQGKAELVQAVELRRTSFKLENIEPGYKLEITGFDRNRDIEIKVRTDSKSDRVVEDDPVEADDSNYLEEEIGLESEEFA